MSNIIEFTRKDKVFKGLLIGWFIEEGAECYGANIEILQEDTRIVITPDQTLEAIQSLITVYKQALLENIANNIPISEPIDQ
jgi:hypothetical protein